MTKAEKIRKLNDGKRTISQIAAVMGCLPEYVRVVLRQRVSGSMSEADNRYIKKKFGGWSGQWKARSAVPGFRDRENERHRQYRKRKRIAEARV